MTLRPGEMKAPPFAIGDFVSIQSARRRLIRPLWCVVGVQGPVHTLEAEGGEQRGVDARETSLVSEDPPQKATSQRWLELSQKLDAQGKLGSFGIHKDAQLFSLKRVREEKQFAKAVKADNAAIPLHLWNDRIPAPTCSSARRARALNDLEEKASELQHQG